MTTKPYKLPRCWLGNFHRVNDQEVRVTADEIDPNCHCETPTQAFWCMEGHLTECHVGLDCKEAECSHLEQYGFGEADHEHL